MGSFFSLRGASEWEQAVAETLEPSIWSYISHTPLKRNQQVLLERPNKVTFAFPHGLMQGSDRIEVSDVADLTLLVGLEETTGRLYSAILLHAAEVTMPHMFYRNCPEDSESSASTRFSGATGGLLGASAVDLTINLEKAQRGTDVRTMVMVKNLPQCCSYEMFVDFLARCGLKDKYRFLHMPVDKTEKRRVNNGGFAFIDFVAPPDVASFYEGFESGCWQATMATTAGSNEAVDGAEFVPASAELPKVAYAKFQGDTDGSQAEAWPYLLLYSVKEGVLAFFSDDRERCEAVVRNIAACFGQHHGKHPPIDPNDDWSRFGSRRGAKGRSSPAPDEEPHAEIAAVDGAAQKVKLLSYPVGRCPPPVARLLQDCLALDLDRRFAVKCKDEEQAHCTNCVVFSLRVMNAFNLSVRGRDIQRLCESREDLGPKTGDAAGDTWEKLVRIVRA